MNPTSQRNMNTTLIGIIIALLIGIVIMGSLLYQEQEKQSHTMQECSDKLFIHLTKQQAPTVEELHSEPLPLLDVVRGE